MILSLATGLGTERRIEELKTPQTFFDGTGHCSTAADEFPAQPSRRPKDLSALR